MPGKHFFYVYRLSGQLKLDGRKPIGGVIVRGAQFPATYEQQVQIIARAYSKAERRFHCGANEYLAVVEQTEPEERLTVLSLEAEFKRELKEFEELMRV